MAEHPARLLIVAPDAPDGPSADSPAGAAGLPAGGWPGANGTAAVLAAVRSAGVEVTTVAGSARAAERLAAEHFGAVLVDPARLAPLERALADHRAAAILDTVGEGVCVIESADADGVTGAARPRRRGAVRVDERADARLARRRARPRDRRRRRGDRALRPRGGLEPRRPPTGRATAPPTSASPRAAPAGSRPPSRSRRFTLTADGGRFLDMVASPVPGPSPLAGGPGGGDAARPRGGRADAGRRGRVGRHRHPPRLQQKVDAIDRAGGELVRLDADAMKSLNVAERLRLLEEKIVAFARELMHFDHFAIRLLDRKSNKLEAVINAGLPAEAMDVELFAEPEGNGISGHVAATGRSYLCTDAARDPRYVAGLGDARSSLTVPLHLNDRVIGVLNIESDRRAAFGEDDRQFAEIFGRYVAVALNILDLMVVERVGTAHKVADDVAAEVAGPLNDIALDAGALLDEFLGDESLRDRLRSILANVDGIRGALRQAAAGPNTILGAKGVTGAAEVAADPVLGGARVLVADDEPNLRQTVADVLRKYRVTVTSCASGAEAIAALDAIHATGGPPFDLVLSDIKMPDKTGYDVFAAAHRLAPDLPVILMTGFGYDPNHCIVRASQEGLAAVLFKPFKVEQLLSECRKAIAE